MVSPEALLAFKLLDGAGLIENQRQLALTACSDLKYENMKAALKRVFVSQFFTMPKTVQTKVRKSN